MLKAYLLKTGREVSPFGRLSTLPVHNRPLAEHQEQALRSAGCAAEWISGPDEIRTTPCVVVHDDVYFTRDAVRRLLRTARREQANLRAALPVSLLTEAIAPGLQGELHQGADERLRLYDLYFVRQLNRELPLQAQSRPKAIRVRFGRKSARTHPRFSDGGRFALPISSVYLCPVRHWSHLVACNLLGMAAHVLDEARRRWLASAALPLTALLRSGSLRARTILGKTYWRGSRCRIHPSAHVEGSVLGERVRIEPNAVVRYCVVGDQAVIGPGACLQGCTIGPRALINGSVQIHGSVFGEEASVGSFFNQLSVIGRRAVICPDAGIHDFNLRGSVPVTVDGQTRRSGSLVLGAAIGDDAFLGPGIQVAGGREVPADCVLVRSPRELIRSGDRDKLPENVHRLDRRRAA